MIFTEPSKITCGQIVHKWENVYNKEIEEPQEERYGSILSNQK